ncbi:MAG: glycosyltransferase family 9 protein [Rubripirellula sp.]
MNQKPPRILISRMSAIGDCILTMPVACALRKQFPDAFLGWVVEKKAAPVVRNHPAVDEVIELERGWFTSLRGIRDTKAKLQNYQFEISIDCQGLTKSALAGRLSGARTRIGYSGRHGGELTPWLNNQLIEPSQTHIVDRSLELLKPLGIENPEVNWQMPIPNTELSWAKNWRTSLKAQAIAILNPGATADSKMWEPDRFGQTAQIIHKRFGYRSVAVWGGAKERAMAEWIVRHSNGSAVLAPDTNLHQLAAMISQSDLFISGDTGPLHMAVALKVPTIGLYGSTRPGDSGPYQQIALQNAYESGSRRHRRRADNSAMRQIHVSDVCAAIDKIHQMHSAKSSKRQLAA